jgi:hypothetical protein
MPNLTSIICTITPIIYHGNIFPLHATTIGSLFPNLRDLDSRLGGCGICGIDYFRIYLKIKKGRFKTNVTLSLILRFNLRLEGYSLWSAILQSHTIPKK